jgi:site-specific recombinase XerD
MRAQVLITLFALYGLRTSEATSLLLKNIDWKTKSFTVRRAKNYKQQRFPIVRSLESPLKRYLEFGRPNCQNEYVIVTLHPPYRPLQVHDVAQIINKRMDHVGIKRAYGGPRYLRHACATRLLTEEMTLQEIADFLGHQDCMTVGVYAQHDVSTLNQVAAVDLCRGLRTFPKRSLAAWNRRGSVYMYLPPLQKS